MPWPRALDSSPSLEWVPCARGHFAGAPTPLDLQRWPSGRQLRPPSAKHWAENLTRLESVPGWCRWPEHRAASELATLQSSSKQLLPGSLPLEPPWPQSPQCFHRKNPRPTADWTATGRAFWRPGCWLSGTRVFSWLLKAPGFVVGLAHCTFLANSWAAGTASSGVQPQPRKRMKSAMADVASVRVVRLDACST